MSLDGTVAVVTGGGRGLGRAIGHHFARDGATVALCARTRSGLDEAAAAIRSDTGRDVLVESVDVTDAGAVRAFAAHVEELVKPVRVLVNCAGILGPVGRIDRVDLDEWRHALDVNVFGVVTSCAAFAPLLAAAGGGAIVNLSGGGVGGPGVQSHISAYTSAKAAVGVLTETLARGLEPLAIRVNAVAPGALATDLMRPVLEAGPDTAGAALYDTARRIFEHAPGDDTFLSPELAALLTFLVSDDSARLSGRVLSARWESPELLRTNAEAIREGSRFTFRRIDETLFREAGPDPSP